MAVASPPLLVSAPAREGVRVEAGYIPAVETLRGIAVLWVVVFHYVVVRDGRFDDPMIATVGLWKPLDVIARNGYLGVDLFFLITGFLLTLPWFERELRGTPPPSIPRFYARRFWRIAPAYYVQLVVLFAFVLPLLKGITYWRADLYVLAFNAIAHGAFIHATSPLTSGSLNINGALWTLALEAQYYALLPLIAIVFLRRPRVALAGAFAIAIAWQLGARYGLDGIVAFELALGMPWGWTEAQVRYLLLTQLPSYLAHFALGILAGRAWLRWRVNPLSTGRRRALQALAAAALVFLYVVYGHLGPFAGEITWIFTPLALGTLFFALAASARPGAPSFFGGGPLAFLGRISYSAYLYHLMLLTLWNRYAPDLGAASFPLYLATVIGVAWLSWRHVELPFLRHGGSTRRLESTRAESM